MRWLDLRLAAVLVGVATSAAVAEPSTAERLYEQGQRAYDGKRYDEALTLWKQSYELSRLPGLVYNLAQAYRLRAQGGDCALAVEHYKRFIALDPKSPQRATAEGFLGELSACTFVAPPPPPPAPRRDPAPRDAGHTKRLAGLVIGGGGVVLLGAGAYFGAQARALGNEVTRECADGCDFADIAQRDADGRSAATKQWVFLGLGAAGLATGGILYVLGRREQAPTVAVSPHGDGAVVTWSRSW